MVSAPSGGRVFPLPSKPLPERDPQQPAEDLQPRWSCSVLHSAPAARPGERLSAENKNSTTEHGQILNQPTCQPSPPNVLFLRLSRSLGCRHPLALPASPGSLCLGCTWCLARMMMMKDRRGGKAQMRVKTLEPAPAKTPRSLLGTWHHSAQAGIQVRALCDETCC